MKKLVVSGCSWGDPYFISMQHPSMDTTWLKWPEILAEKMNMEPVNLCKSGMGNEYIYSSLSDYLSKININEVGALQKILSFLDEKLIAPSIVLFKVNVFPTKSRG